MRKTLAVLAVLGLAQIAEAKTEYIVEGGVVKAVTVYNAQDAANLESALTAQVADFQRQIDTLAARLATAQKELDEKNAELTSLQSTK